MVSDLIPEGSLWRHEKTQRVYVVCGNCTIERTMNPAVLYREYPGGTRIWCRPTYEFQDGRFIRL